MSSSRILPRGWPNPLLTAGHGVRLPTPDLWSDDVALAVQVHSRRYHGSPADRDDTVASDGVYAEHGVPVVAVTPHMIGADADATLRRIEAAYRAALAKPRPVVVARPIGPASRFVGLAFVGQRPKRCVCMSSSSVDASSSES